MKNFVMDISLSQGHFYMSKIKIMSPTTEQIMDSTLQNLYLVCSQIFVTVTSIHRVMRILVPGKIRVMQDLTDSYVL